MPGVISATFISHENVSAGNWEEFFRAHGWRAAETRYLPIEGERLGRPLPLPWWFVPVYAILPRRAREAIRHMIGYARLEPT